MSPSHGKLDINLTNVFEKLLGDQELGYLVLFHFREQLKEEISLMGDLIVGEDFDQMFERAHALKGAAAIAGAELIYDLLAEIQGASRKCDINLCNTLLDELKIKAEIFLSCLNNIQGFVSKYGNEENISC